VLIRGVNWWINGKLLKPNQRQFLKILDLKSHIEKSSIFALKLNSQIESLKEEFILMNLLSCINLF